WSSEGPCSDGLERPQPPAAPLPTALPHCRLKALGTGGVMEMPAGGPAISDRAIRFEGNWREYLPIAVTNALLIICTLGVYRFWATASKLRYLWSRTRLIDHAYEWSWTGKEMFFGFLIVIAVLAPFFLFVQFLFP